MHVCKQTLQPSVWLLITVFGTKPKDRKWSDNTEDKALLYIWLACSEDPIYPIFIPYRPPEIISEHRAKTKPWALLVCCPSKKRGKKDNTSHGKRILNFNKAFRQEHRQNSWEKGYESTSATLHNDNTLSYISMYVRTYHYIQRMKAILNFFMLHFFKHWTDLKYCL